jgi:DNA-binding transcriptional LysR family regulator
MQLKHLRTFAVVADTLSLTRAAAKLHLAQSSVSEQIQALELDLGVRLFDRPKRKLVLTAAGNRLLDYAVRILALSDEARSVMRAEASRLCGRLAVGGIDSLCLERLPALILAYCTQFPDVQISLRPGKAVDLRGHLKAGTLDIYFTFGKAVEAGLCSETLGKEPIVLVGPPGHRLAGKPHVKFGELSTERFLLTVPGCPMREAFEQELARSGAKRPQVIGEFASIAALRNLVETGAGCALVPRAAVQEAIASGKVTALAWSGAADIPISMVWRTPPETASPLGRFLDTARRELSAGVES